MSGAFFKLLGDLSGNGPVWALAGLLVMFIGLLLFLLWRSNNARLDDAPKLITALLEATAAQERVVEQQAEANRTRDALVAAMSAQTFETKALSFEIRALAQTMGNEGNMNRLSLAGAIKTLDQMMVRQGEILQAIQSLGRA